MTNFPQGTGDSCARCLASADSRSPVGCQGLHTYVGSIAQDTGCAFANAICLDSDVEHGAAIAEFHGFPYFIRACLPATRWTKLISYFGSAARYAVGDSPRTRWKVRLKCVSD